MTSKQISFVGVGSGYLGPGMDKPEDGSLLAKNIFERYDKDRGGTLGHTEVANIMIDMYRSLNKAFTPSKSDIDGFFRVLDMNRDGKVEQRDLEALIAKHLRVGVEVTKTTITKSTISNLTTSRML